MAAAGQRQVEETRAKESSEGERAADFDRKLHSLHHCGNILGVAEVTWINERMVVRVTGAQF